MKKIKLSIIVIVFNVERYIERCLKSIIDQTYTNLEIICVNDGSTDNSLAIIENYAKKDNRIKIINCKNNGPSAARNRGISAAQGDFISFVDGDDLLVQNAYEKIVSYINDDIDVIWFEPKIIYENYDLYQYWNVSDNSWYDLKYSGRVYLTDSMFINSDCNVWNKLFRLDKLKKSKVEFPEGLIYEDAVFCYNIFLKLRSVYFLKEKLYIYNRRKKSFMDITKNKENRIGLNHIEILDKIYDYWLENNYLSNKQFSFLKICEKLFNDALRNVEPYEKSLIFWEMTKRLRKWNLHYEFNSLFDRLINGKFDFIY